MPSTTLVENALKSPAAFVERKATCPTTALRNLKLQANTLRREKIKKIMRTIQLKNLNQKTPKTSLTTWKPPLPPDMKKNPHLLGITQSRTKQNQPNLSLLKPPKANHGAWTKPFLTPMTHNTQVKNVFIRLTRTLTHKSDNVQPRSSPNQILKLLDPETRKPD